MIHHFAEKVVFTFTVYTGRKWAGERYNVFRIVFFIHGIGKGKLYFEKYYTLTGLYTRN